MATPTQTLLQEVFILATGRAANAEDLTWLNSLLGPQGNDYSGLVREVDAYMNSLVPAHGVAGLVKTVAINGLGLVLDDAQTASVIKDLMAQGIDTWGELFAFCVTLENSLGTVLNNRAAAAQGFVDALNASNKAGFYKGDGASSAVKTLLQNINDSATSLANGQHGFAALAANLSTSGIKGAVVDGYVRGATVFIDTNNNGRLDAPEETSTTTDVNGNFVLPKNIGTGKIVAFGGTDIMTGKPFQGVLTAPVGSTVVNPLTTLVQTMQATGNTKAAEQIKQRWACLATSICSATTRWQCWPATRARQTKPRRWLCRNLCSRLPTSLARPAPSSAGRTASTSQQLPTP